MSDQVVHSFPPDTSSSTARADSTEDKTDEEPPYQTKNSSPNGVSDSVSGDCSPLFRPKSRLLIKRKSKDFTELVRQPSTVVSSSTPTKVKLNYSTISQDLFSDDSLNLNDSTRPALCEDYGRHTVIDCSVG